MRTAKNNIRKLREERGMSQTQLGDEFGVTRSCVTQWEAGIVSPTADKLVRLADYFGTTTDYLLGRSDRRHPDEKGCELPALGQLDTAYMRKALLDCMDACASAKDSYLEDAMAAMKDDDPEGAMRALQRVTDTRAQREAFEEALSALDEYRDVAGHAL